MSRYDLTRDDIALALSGEPRYRVDQLMHGMYGRLVDPEEISELPAGLRARLSSDERLAPGLREVTEQVSDDGSTLKWLFSTADDRRIETVLMGYDRRRTVCVSSQVGCAMGCSFCATGDQGFGRNLSKGEIVEQVVRAARRASSLGWGRITNVVFMGMGEPLSNLRAVWPALVVCNGELGLAARHLTVSTVGIVPGILRLATEPLQVNLAVSLHAGNDTLRDQLVPVNRRYPLGQLIVACETYVASTGRRLSLEWACMDQVNDRRSDAEELAGIARPLGAHVNLIPLNPTPGGSANGLAGSPPARVRALQEWLGELGVNATVRRNRGREIAAACGQLATRFGPDHLRRARGQGRLVAQSRLIEQDPPGTDGTASGRRVSSER